MQNIAAQKNAVESTRAQAGLEASETRYRRLLETAQDGILILDADTGNSEDINPFLIDTLGYSKNEIMGKKLWEIGAFRDIRESQAAFSELQTKEYVRYEDLPLETKDGRSINVEFISNVYHVDHQRVVQCNIRDITERRRAEEAVGQSLEEKGVLLKELHHRVKNNLQIIASLLQLKLANSKDAEVIDVFKQTQERIKVMALVHQKLSEAKDFMSIDISGYVNDLVDSLIIAYGVDRKRIIVKVDVAKVLLKIDLAVPGGLIINELLTNSFEYAFPGNRRGEIFVALRLNNTRLLEIKVSDNGIGLSKGFNLHRTKTMGLALVVSTIENQWGGRIKLKRKRGAQFTVIFNIVPVTEVLALPAGRQGAAFAGRLRSGRFPIRRYAL